MTNRIWNKPSLAGRVSIAVEAVEQAERDLKHYCERDVYDKLERTLDSRLGNVGLNSDFVNKAYYLSDTSRAEKTRYGGVVPKKGMLVLCEDDAPGEYLILRMADDDGNIEEEPVAAGGVRHGQLSAALRQIVNLSRA